MHWLWEPLLGVIKVGQALKGMTALHPSLLGRVHLAAGENVSAVGRVCPTGRLRNRFPGIEGRSCSIMLVKHEVSVVSLADPARAQGSTSLAQRQHLS